MDRGKSVMPANRTDDDFYISFLRKWEDETFAEYASWHMAMAEITGAEIGFFFEDTLATAHPGEGIATIYWRWQERRAVCE